MKRGRFSEEQIVAILKEHEAGRKIAELEALRSAPSCEGIEAAKIDLLTHREMQVAECAAQGQSNKQIADRLGLRAGRLRTFRLSK